MKYDGFKLLSKKKMLIPIIVASGSTPWVFNKYGELKGFVISISIGVFIYLIYRIVSSKKTS